MLAQPTSYSYKLDWAQACERWNAFWNMAATDRPCLSVTAPRPGVATAQLPEVASVQDKWMLPEYALSRTINYLDETYLGGEAVPRAPGIMAGSALGCGDDGVAFGAGGISIRPSMTSIGGPLNWHPGPRDPWRPKVDAIVHRLLDEAPGRYIVGVPNGMFRHIDLLNMLRGNTEIMLDMALQPQQCRARLLELRDLTWENERHYADLIGVRQGDVGAISWTGVWSKERFKCSQADAAACISPEMFAELVLPELDAEGERFGCIHYHTCGYWQHLEACLTRPYIKVIQYSPGPKESPEESSRLPFYRRVQQAGRCLDLAVGLDQAEYLIRHLRPEGLHLAVTVGTVAAAEELLENAVKWCGTDVHRSP